MRLGIFGGAFNPLHKEHIRIIEESRRVLDLDGVILVPTINPPHKERSSTSFYHRAEMLRVWAMGKDYILIDEIENDLKLTHSYTYRVLPRLIKKYGKSELFYIIGGDSMVRFHTWKHPEKIASLVKLAVAGREGYPGLDEAVTSARNKYGADITLLNITGSAVSSGELRARLELKLDTKGYVEEGILEYIRSNSLYNEYSDLINTVRMTLSPELFSHSAGSAVFAVKYADILGVDFRKAFVAALLHDIAKERSPIFPENAVFPPKVVHQYDGRTVAEMEYGISDPEILDSIGYHTTAKPRMSVLAKLVYLADKLEEGRRYEGVDKLRAITDKDFHEGFRATLRHSYGVVKERGGKIDGLTEDAYKYYNHNII